MATYVLVHGAWSGGWGYKAVARALRAAGHEVYVPTLTGLGERDHLTGLPIDLSLHVRDVVNMIEYEDLDDVILCGHSYGGMVITGVAAAIGERIRTLFYLDAFLPKDGEALWDIADEGSRRHYIDAQRDEPGWIAPFPRAGDTRKRNRHPLLTLTEPVRFSGKEAAVKHRTYVYATRDAPTVFTKFHAAVKSDPAWRVHEIATGHIVMFDDPDGLVGLLLEEAER